MDQHFRRYKNEKKGGKKRRRKKAGKKGLPWWAFSLAVSWGSVRAVGEAESGEGSPSTSSSLSPMEAWPSREPGPEPEPSAASAESPALPLPAPLPAPLPPDAARRRRSGTNSTCPGNTSRVASRFILASSDGVVSKRAATEVRVSESFTCTTHMLFYSRALRWLVGWMKPATLIGGIQGWRGS